MQPGGSALYQWNVVNETGKTQNGADPAADARRQNGRCVRILENAAGAIFVIVQIQAKRHLDSGGASANRDDVMSSIFPADRQPMRFRPGHDGLIVFRLGPELFSVLFGCEEMLELRIARLRNMGDERSGAGRIA
jgi:hypothetical protein